MIHLYIVQYSEDYDLVFTMSMQRAFKIDSQSIYADKYMHQFSSFLMHNLSNAPEESRGKGFVVQLANFLI